MRAPSVTGNNLHMANFEFFVSKEQELIRLGLKEYNDIGHQEQRYRHNPETFLENELALYGVEIDYSQRNGLGYRGESRSDLISKERRHLQRWMAEEQETMAKREAPARSPAGRAKVSRKKEKKPGFDFHAGRALSMTDTGHGKGRVVKADGSIEVYKTKETPHSQFGTTTTVTKTIGKKHLAIAEKHEKKLLKKAATASKKSATATVAEVDGRWLKIDGFQEAMAERNPWMLHFIGKGSKGKEPRVLSITRMARDGAGALWVQGDALGLKKKADAVGLAVSITDVQCQKVKAMAIGKK